MALRIGKHAATIVTHSLRNIGDKEAVSFMCRTEGDDDQFEVLIWLTEKAMGIARASLKLCGFSVDDADLWDLQGNQTLLAGNRINVLAEEWNGRMRAQILLQSEPTQKRAKEIQTQLRAVKKDTEDDGDLPF